VRLRKSGGCRLVSLGQLRPSGPLDTERNLTGSHPDSPAESGRLATVGSGLCTEHKSASWVLVHGWREHRMGIGVSGVARAWRKLAWRKLAWWLLAAVS
jgi:hypothetical protein